MNNHDNNDTNDDMSVATSTTRPLSSPKLLQQVSTPELYMIITNISKRANVKSLLLSGLAFGCRGFFIVGQKNFDFSSAMGNNSSSSNSISTTISNLVQRFESLDECVQYVKHTKQAQICGIEIVDSALNIDSDPFTTSICIMAGNEGTGLSERQMKHCDYFIKISQFGGGTASLNVCVAASIVMQRFFQWRIATLGKKELR